jgi:hypothetical protein
LRSLWLTATEGDSNKSRSNGWNWQSNKESNNPVANPTTRGEPSRRKTTCRFPHLVENEIYLAYLEPDDLDRHNALTETRPAANVRHANRLVVPAALAAAFPSGPRAESFSVRR